MYTGNKKRRLFWYIYIYNYSLEKEKLLNRQTYQPMTLFFVFEGNNTTLREKMLWETSLNLEKWVMKVNTETFEWRSKNKPRLFVWGNK